MRLQSGRPYSETIMPNLIPTYDMVMAFLSFLRVRTATAWGDLNILGLQGMSPVGATAPDFVGTELALNANVENEYNDTFVLASLSPTGRKQLSCFLGTVDPGATKVLGGIAHLTQGQHLYAPGYHQSSTHGSDFPCLRGADGVNRIWRRAEDGTCSVQTGKFGVNIHAGGSYQFVNNWSKGCGNICGNWTGTAYRRFLALRDEHFRDGRKTSVGVTIWSGRDFTRFATEGWTMKPTLRFGMLTPWAGELQGLLVKKGLFQGTVDGDFGTKTLAAVQHLQGSVGLPADGVVGKLTWMALGA